MSGARKPSRLPRPTADRLEVAEFIGCHEKTVRLPPRSARELRCDRELVEPLQRFEVGRKVARPAGFEPATLGSGGRYSIQLSYGRILSTCRSVVRLVLKAGAYRPGRQSAIARMACQLQPVIVNERRLVRPEGFEPPTYGFEARRSIQLSYGRKAIASDGQQYRALPTKRLTIIATLTRPCKRHRCSSRPTPGKTHRPAEAGYHLRYHGPAEAGYHLGFEFGVS
jgi:hypothetical protein